MLTRGFNVLCWLSYRFISRNRWITSTTAGGALMEIFAFFVDEQIALKANFYRKEISRYCKKYIELGSSKGLANVSLCFGRF